MMTTTEKLQTMKPSRLFLSYLIPSLLGMMLMAVNILIDGLFVSHGVGERALAGVNVAVPVYSILLSISLWIGMGGATMYSIALGRGEQKRAQSIFSQAIVTAVLLTSVIIIFSLIFEKQMAYFFGATDEIYPFVRDYLHVILVAGLIYILENILSIFIRNDGNPVLATAGLVVNSILNIILNYIFIFQFGWGVKGAAWATVIATIIGTLVLLLHFRKPTNHLKFITWRLEWATVKSMLLIGLPSFIVEGSAAIMIVATNMSFKHFTGELGITAFAVVNYVHAVFIMIFIGVGAALQPITSYHHGAKLFDRLQTFVKIAVWTGFGIGLFSFLVGSLASDVFIDLFAIQNEEVAAFTRKGIVLFFIGYLFLGVNMVYAEFYQSIEQIRFATLIILSRSLVFLLPSLWILPTLFGPDAIWLAFPVAEGITLLLLIVFKTYRKHRDQSLIS